MHVELAPQKVCANLLQSPDYGLKPATTSVLALVLLLVRHGLKAEASNRTHTTFQASLNLSTDTCVLKTRAFKSVGSLFVIPSNLYLSVYHKPPQVPCRP